MEFHQILVICCAFGVLVSILLQWSSDKQEEEDDDC